ncbi:MAG: DUF4126 domain-containing protein [Verrucomicrobiales bacterium]|nr:DUF4126 domain-containing protein [Verrucomicrobiales bacterium]
METALNILAGLGLAAACGFRVFVPLFIASMSIHAGLIVPTAEFSWLGSVPAMVTFGVATGLEIAAYYIPWLDHALDTLASPAAVVAGSIVAASFVSDMDPFFKWTLAIIAGGGLAATVQAVSVAVRGVSFSLTGGLANPAVATAELGGAVAASALAVVAPWMAFFGIAAVLLILATMWNRRRRAAE